MKIKRNINGQEVTIELTDAEIQEAYSFQRTENNKDYVIENIERLISESGDDDNDEVFWNQQTATVGQLRKLLEDDDAIERMAEDYCWRSDGHEGVTNILNALCEEVINDYIE